MAGAFNPDFGYRIIEATNHKIDDSKIEKVEEEELEPFLDFILYSPRTNNEDKTPQLLSEFLRANQGKKIPLLVYNLIQRDTR